MRLDAISNVPLDGRYTQEALAWTVRSCLANNEDLVRGILITSPPSWWRAYMSSAHTCTSYLDNTHAFECIGFIPLLQLENGKVIDIIVVNHGIDIRTWELWLDWALAVPPLDIVGRLPNTDANREIVQDLSYRISIQIPALL